MSEAAERLDRMVDDLRLREDAPQTLVERLAADVDCFTELLDLAVQLRDAALLASERSEHTATLIQRHAETTDLVDFQNSVQQDIESL